MTERTLAGPTLDLRKPNAVVWECDFSTLGKEEFDAELVLGVDLATIEAMYVGSGKSPLRMSIEMSDGGTPTSPSRPPILPVTVRPFDDAGRLTTDGYSTVLLRFVGGGSRKLRFRMDIEVADPVIAANSPRLFVRPFYLAK